MASLLLEQQEKLRRVVDEWRIRSHVLLGGLVTDPFAVVSPPPSTSRSDPVSLHVEPMEHSHLFELLQSDNVAVSKFVMVLSYDCIEISSLSDLASKNLYRQLHLFSHRSSSQELLLEGEPQKAFAESLSLFVELYEITTRMADVLGNLLQQLNSVYSLRDKNVRPLNSIRNLILRTAFEALGEGLAVFLVLDEIIKRNEHIKSYMSLFSRMLNKVKLELDTFDVTVEDVDLLDRVVGHFEKLLEVSFFQWVLYKESSWQGTMEQIKCNKRFIDGCFSCIHEGFLEVSPRLNTWKEPPLDRWKIFQHMALFIFSTHASAVGPEKKLVKVLTDMIHLAPLIYVKGNRIILIDMLKEQCSPSLFSWPLIRETIRDRNVMNSNYLKRLSEFHLRDWQAIKDSLSCWIASFHSTVHPSAELLSEGWLRLHLRKTMQGLILADRLQLLIISILDLHSLLEHEPSLLSITIGDEVPIKREKLKSLCHMITSLKVLEQIFHIREPDMIRSLPHIINIIQADIEQLILPFKHMLQVEVDKGSQLSKMGFLSSLTRGGKETDTRIADSLSLVHLSLQMLQGGGSLKRQLVFLNILDVLRSIGYLDIGFPRVWKLASKLRILANFNTIISNITDCSFLYWRREMMGKLFSIVYEDVRRSSWLQYLLDAFSDGVRLLELGKAGKLTLEAYQKEIEYNVKNEIVAPLCRDIETDLRLHVHSTYLKGSVVVNPTKTGVRNLAWYLEIKPLRLPFKFINIRLLVESYLNSAFYNHSTMSTYDRKIYVEMQLLAALKYQLCLDDIHFIGNSMVQNIDIHEIFQDLHSFTENYSYNIVKQVFIEKVPKGQNKKNLRLIGVKEVTNSIAIHGQKGLYQASNTTLKFLNGIFTTLSQLFREDYSMAESSNKYIFLKNDKEIVNGLPFMPQGDPRCAIGRLALGDHERNFLEQLQNILTKIGNALGLVRILQTGSSRHLNNISRFTVDVSFGENFEKAGFADEILSAGRMMDEAIEENCKPDARMESLSFLITTFIEEYQFSKDNPLKNLFHTIPAAVVNLINSRFREEDKLLMKEHDSGTTLYMDDSFFMGVAFALKVLGQEKSFDDLNWFASVRKILDNGISSLEGSCKIQDNSNVVSLARLKLWSQTPPIPLETRKELDDLKRYRKEIEFVQHVLNIAKTLMS